MNIEDYVNRRPPSEQLVDLHISVVPMEHWIERLNYASFKVISDTFSIGFIRVQPESNIHSIRQDITRQLGEDILPQKYVFLKHVGRCLALVREKQENQLKVKNFLPPLNTMPEIFVLPGMPSMYKYAVLPPIKPQIGDSPNNGVDREQGKEMYEYSTSYNNGQTRSSHENGLQFHREPVEPGKTNSPENTVSHHNKSTELESVVRKHRHVSGKSAYTRELATGAKRQPTTPGQAHEDWNESELQDNYSQQQIDLPIEAKSIVHEGPSQKQVHYSMPTSPYSDEDDDQHHNPSQPNSNHSPNLNQSITHHSHPSHHSPSHALSPQSYQQPLSKNTNSMSTDIPLPSSTSPSNEMSHNNSMPHNDNVPNHEAELVAPQQIHDSPNKTHSHHTVVVESPQQHNSPPIVADHISTLSHNSSDSIKSKRRRFIQSPVEDSVNGQNDAGYDSLPFDQNNFSESHKNSPTESQPSPQKFNHSSSESQHSSETAVLAPIQKPKHYSSDQHTQQPCSPSSESENPLNYPSTHPYISTHNPNTTPHDLLFLQPPETQIPPNTPVTVSNKSSTKGSAMSKVKEMDKIPHQSHAEQHEALNDRSRNSRHRNKIQQDDEYENKEIETAPQMVGDYANDPKKTDSNTPDGQYNAYFDPRLSNRGYQEFEKPRENIPPFVKSSEEIHRKGTAVITQYKYNPEENNIISHKNEEHKSKPKGSEDNQYSPSDIDKQNFSKQDSENNTFLTETFTENPDKPNASLKEYFPANSPLRTQHIVSYVANESPSQKRTRGAPDGMPMAPVFSSGSGQYQPVANTVTPPNNNTSHSPQNQSVLPDKQTNNRDNRNANILPNDFESNVQDSPEPIQIPQFNKPPVDSSLNEFNTNTQQREPPQKTSSSPVAQIAPQKSKQDDSNKLQLKSSTRRIETPDKAALWEELQKIRASRRQTEDSRQELVRKAKNISSKIAQKRTTARDQWKKQYFKEKKRTAPLEELCNRLRSQLDTSHQRLLTSLAEQSNEKVSLVITALGRKNQPSIKSNNKIRVSKLQHDLDALRRKVQDAKVKLSGEIKLRHQAEQDVKVMREDLMRKKIQSHVAYRKVARTNNFLGRQNRALHAYN